MQQIKNNVDDAISNLGNIVSGNATLNFAGNVTKKCTRSSN